MMRLIFWTLVFLAFAAQVFALEWEDSPAATAVFAEYGLAGTFVVYDDSKPAYAGHDRERAERRFIPASTFKIANSLIGLSVGAVGGVDEPIPYVGGTSARKEWQRDMGLREAIAVSNVPIYQELARRVGLERMAAAVAGLEYGNGAVGEAVDTFWLRGPLEISAVEQCRFLSRLARRELPLPKTVQDDVCGILILEQGDGWTLYGKTGAATAHEPSLGWWVGWVEKGDAVFAFALNIDMSDFDADAPKRLAVGMACLRAAGVLPPLG